jgi:uncharacterized membrane protein
MERHTTEQRIAAGLGWFSIGLGVAEIVMPGRMARFIGVRDEDGTRALLRFYGLREIASGVGILSSTQPAGWLWSRVAGDLLDLASLGSAMKSDDASRTRLAGASAAVMGVAALDVYCAQKLSGDAAAASGSTRRTSTISVNRSPEEVYQFWRNFENLPRFMSHLESVRVTTEGRSHWKAKAPAGTTVEWDAELVEDQPNSFIAWRSAVGADVSNSGFVRFERGPGGRGTVVTVELQYTPPGGVIGSAIAKLFGQEPGQQIDHDLRAFKQVMETGEVVHSDASIHDGMHPARPAGALRRGGDTPARSPYGETAGSRPEPVQTY